MYKKAEDPWAYLAGFIEGDGCITLYKGMRGTITVLTITQKERAILDYFREFTGVGQVYSRQGKQIGWRSGFHQCWQVTSKDGFEKVLPQVIPHLFSSKKRKARLLLRFCKTRDSNVTSRGVSSTTRKYRRRILREWGEIPTNEIKKVANPSYSLLAGFVDSDGWVGKLANRYWRVTIVQKSKVILDYLREEAGGIGNIHRRKNGVHSWTITSQSFLEELNPYLKIKRKKI